MVAINRSVALSGEDDIAVVTIDPPPVGRLSLSLREGLWKALDETLSAGEVHGIVLLWGAGPGEAARDAEGDFETDGPSLDAIIDRIEAGEKPVVAMLRGSVLGSALSLALACHHRLAMPRTRLGFPQVPLGLIPGHGATQRLPRLIGVRRALEMMLGAEALGAASAQVIGLVDEVAAGDPTLAATRIARSAAEPHRPLRPLRERTDRLGTAGEAPPLFWDARRRYEERLGRSRAFEGVLQAVRAAVDLPFEAGMAREAEILAGLREEGGLSPTAVPAVAVAGAAVDDSPGTGG